ncbi:hypothetical protein PTKIN_Ptkin08bG0208500 [Pterospermum kingtungense]
MWKYGPHVANALSELIVSLAIVIYVKNMLKLESGEIGELVGSTMLMVVVDRLIELDVSGIGWDTILQYDFSKGIFEIELEDVNDIVESDEADTEEVYPTCFYFFLVFETLLQSFPITVLSAYKSKFTQLVIFYACALDPENCGMRFATILEDLFAQDSHPQPTRMSAVAYLASYLSIAKFLSASFISIMLKRFYAVILEIIFLSHYVCSLLSYESFYCSTVEVTAAAHATGQILKHRLNPLKFDAYDDDNDAGSNDDDPIQDFVNEKEDIVNDVVGKSFDEENVNHTKE